MNKEVYFDNSATTMPYKSVLDAMNKVNSEIYGNPSSLHKMGLESENIIKESKNIVANSLGVNKEQIYFTSGGTESNNLAILGYLEGNKRNGNHIITTSIEHPSVLEVFKYLETKGYKTDFLNVSEEGIIDLEELKSLITKDTALISIIHINNETGSVQPIEEAVKIKNNIKKDTAIHIDGIQGYGKMRVLPEKLGIDLMSFSSHKIHGPKGVGGLYLKKGTKLAGIFFGGGQQKGIRPGTENVPGIYGFATAVDFAFQKIDENYSKVQELKEFFVEELKKNIDQFEILSPSFASPYILNISFKNIKAEVLLHHLEQKNIFVSTGSACSSRKNTHSHVLKAMGIKPALIEGAVRFSFSHQNTIDEVKYGIENIREILPVIRIKGGLKR